MIHFVSTGETDQPRFTMLPGDLQGHLAGMAYYSVKTNTTDVHLFKAKIVRSSQNIAFEVGLPVELSEEMTVIHI